MTSSVHYLLALTLLKCYIVMSVGSGSSVIGPREYCNMEQFNATCGRDEVILMESAEYGRMRIGRCVKAAYGHLECSVPVLGLMDVTCSGRHACSFNVPLSEMYDLHPCNQDFTSYLEAAYRCIRVATGTHKACTASNALKLTGNSGYLASVVTNEYGAGSVHCPWLIRASEGQKINLTLYNFLRPAELDAGNRNVIKYGDHRRGTNNCYELIVVREAGKQTPKIVCAGKDREELFYVSSTHEVNVHFVNRRYLGVGGHLVIKYEASGCPKLRTMDNAWVTNEADGTVSVKCNHTDETWYLTCKGNGWVGHIGNCTKAYVWGLGNFFVQGRQFPFGILMVIGIGVVLGVLVGSVLLSCVMLYTKRRYGQPSKKKEPCVVENKPIVSHSRHPSTDNSRQSAHMRESYTHPPVEDRYPVQPLARPGGVALDFHTYPRPVGPPPPPPPNAQPGEAFMRAMATLESETYYGSSGISSLSTFNPRSHIYESPNFT